MMDERDFELLLVLNKTRNITHAADLLYVSQSSLSKRIAAIETELATKILIRSRKGVHFTPEGEEVVKYATLVSARLQEMRQRIDFSKNIISGFLRAGISLNFTLFRLSPIINEYHKRFPEVGMHITTEHSAELHKRLLEGTLDVAIIRGEFPWNGERILIERENICVIRNQELKDTPLQDLTYIGRKTDLVFESQLGKWLRENQLEPKNANVYVDNITTCVDMVKAGNGWSVVPEIALDHFTGDVVPLKFANGEPFVRSTYLMFSADILKLPQVFEFIELVKHFNKMEV